jgi:hypothetical protein
LTAPAGFRTCKVCNLVKEKSNFQPQGYQCRECRTEKQRAYWNALSPEVKKIRQKNGEYQKRWVALNPEKAKEHSRRTHIMRKFGLTVEQYDTMLAEQNNGCAICGQSCATGMNLAVDHDHATGKVRALLCKNCNTAIGLLGEDTDRMAKAIEYIQFHSERIS